MPLSAEVLGCGDSCGNNLSNLSTNLTLSQGEGVSTPVIISIGLPPNTTPINLTGYSVEMQINFPALLLLTTSNGGITLPDAAAGETQINISGTMSNGFPIGEYPYDFWIISPDNTPWRIFGGLFTVLQSIL